MKRKPDTLILDIRLKIRQDEHPDLYAVLKDCDSMPVRIRDALKYLVKVGALTSTGFVPPVGGSVVVVSPQQPAALPPHSTESVPTVIVADSVQPPPVTPQPKVEPLTTTTATVVEPKQESDTVGTVAHTPEGKRPSWVAKAALSSTQ
jgi:hypothetical protein